MKSIMALKNTGCSFLKNILCFLALLVFSSYNATVIKEPIPTDSTNNGSFNKQLGDSIHIYISSTARIYIVKNTVTNLPAPNGKEIQLIENEKENSAPKLASKTKIRKDVDKLLPKKLKSPKESAPPSSFFYKIPSENENLFSRSGISKLVFQISNFQYTADKAFVERLFLTFIFAYFENIRTEHSDIFYKYLLVSTLTTRPPPVC